METWLLILLIVLGVAILVIIVSAITYKCMKYGVDIQTQPVVEKRSIYCSSDLNKVAKVDYSSSIYGQPQAVNSNGRALDKDGF
jgi:type II secretory pathway component PulC